MLEYSKYNQPEELYKSQKEPNTQFKYGYNTPSYISKKRVTEKSKGYVRWKDRSSHQGCPMKEVFLKISQNSQENTCARVSFLIKLLDLLKNRLWHSCFPVDFAKFLRTPFLENTFGLLLLEGERLSWNTYVRSQCHWSQYFLISVSFLFFSFAL